MTFSEKKRALPPHLNVLCILFFGLALSFSAILQCSGLTLFGVIPDFTFSLVCAIGFILGERYGACFGLFGGVLIMYLGSGEISFSPIMLTLCGYVCGALPTLILRRNFLSYLVYTVIMGAVHIFFTVIYLFLFSNSYDLWAVIGKRILPELILCIILMIAEYGVVFLLYKLFKGKRKNK